MLQAHIFLWANVSRQTDPRRNTGVPATEVQEFPELLSSQKHSMKQLLRHKKDLHQS